MFWWTFLIFILGLDLDALLFRIKRVLWLVKSLPNALQGCDESPLPRDFFERLFWYGKRLRGVLLLYKLLIAH